MRHKKTLFLLLLLLLLSCQSNFHFGENIPVNEFTIKDTMIFDGNQNAVVKLGMKRNEIIKIYGEDLDIMINPGKPPFNIGLMYFHDKVVAISIVGRKDESSVYNIKTYRGLSLSSTIEDIKTAYRTDTEYLYETEYSIFMFFDTREKQIIQILPPIKNLDERDEPYLFALHFNMSKDGVLSGIVLTE